MIFDFDYDKSLWLILKSERINKDKIINFIKSIPKGLYEDIYKSVKVYREEYYGIDDLEMVVDDRLYGDIKSSKNNTFWYNIDLLDGSLFLGYGFLCNDKFYDIFEMKLLSYDGFKKDKCDDLEEIGFINYDITSTERMITCCWKDYNFINTSFGNYIVSILEDRNGRNKISLSRIDLRCLPDEIFIDDFNNVKRLLRGKRR